MTSKYRSADWCFFNVYVPFVIMFYKSVDLITLFVWKFAQSYIKIFTNWTDWRIWVVAKQVKKTPALLSIGWCLSCNILQNPTEVSYLTSSKWISSSLYAEVLCWRGLQYAAEQHPTFNNGIKVNIAPKIRKNTSPLRIPSTRIMAPRTSRNMRKKFQLLCMA